jgi:hypothetical protein
MPDRRMRRVGWILSSRHNAGKAGTYGDIDQSLVFVDLCGLRSIHDVAKKDQKWERGERTAEWGLSRCMSYCHTYSLSILVKFSSEPALFLVVPNLTPDYS